MAAAHDWVEIKPSSSVDAGDLLGRLNDPSVAGAWQDNGTSRFYWPADQWGPDTLERLKQAWRQMGEERASETITVAAVPAQDWNEQWARSVKPIRIGRRIVIRPSRARGCSCRAFCLKTGRRSQAPFPPLAVRWPARRSATAGWQWKFKPGLFMMVRREIAQTRCETGAWSREGPRRT